MEKLNRIFEKKCLKIFFLYSATMPLKMSVSFDFYSDSFSNAIIYNYNNV